MLNIIFIIILSHSKATASTVANLMNELRTVYAKTKWSDTLYKETNWKTFKKESVKGRPLIYYTCGENNKNTTLLLSTIHGDEITPVYFGLRLVSWVKGEPDLCRDHRIIIAPIVNPDGALLARPTRTNGNGVDLNRNFPTEDFSLEAIHKWKSVYKSDRRRYPGEVGGSEPETEFQQWLISEFKPDKILSVHSPLAFFDYDGPEDAVSKNFTKDYLESCKRLKLAVKKASGSYSFLKFGYFTGSLGHYAGKERGIPTLTLELPSVDASKAKLYFETLKKGTRALIVNKVEGHDNQSK